MSAEAFGDWNKKGDFVARVIEKSEETQTAIAKRLSQSFMFNSLSEKEFKIVVGAMEEKRFEVGDYVIKEGEDGAELFVVENGTLSCYK